MELKLLKVFDTMPTRNALLDTSFLSRTTNGTFNIQKLPVAHYKLWLHDICLQEAFLNEAGQQQLTSSKKLCLIKKLKINLFYFSYLIVEEFIDKNPNVKLKSYKKLTNSMLDRLKHLLSSRGKEERERIKATIIKEDKEKNIRLFKKFTFPQESKVTITHEEIISIYKDTVENKEKCKEIIKIILQEHIKHLQDSNGLKLPAQYQMTLKKINDLEKESDGKEIVDFLLEKYFSQDGFNINIEKELPAFYDFLVLFTFISHLRSTLELKGPSFCLMSELPQNIKLNGKKIYFKKQDSKLEYFTLAPTQNEIIGQLDILVPGDLTEEFLNNKKLEILKTLSERNHIIPKESKVAISPSVEIKDFRTEETEFVSEITVDKNTRPDLNSTIGSLNYVDVFVTCDKSQATLLIFLYPKYKGKIQWYSQPSKP